MPLPEQFAEAEAFIRTSTQDFSPETAIILGTGLGALVREIACTYRIPYSEIPHFPLSTVESHSGQLLFGTLNGKRVVCMQGRFHFYEGYSMQQVTFPVRIMKRLGAGTLLVSNASGGLNPGFQTGDLMVITDHISLFLPENPLTGTHYPGFGDRFPDMCDLYHPALVQAAEAIARTQGLNLRKGVYCYASGPQLETRAEYRMLRQLGADAVGMSTVPEIMVGHQMGMRCFGLSVITDMGIPETLKKTALAEILAIAAQAEPGLTAIMKEMVRQ